MKSLLIATPMHSNSNGLQRLFHAVIQHGIQMTDCDDSGSRGITNDPLAIGSGDFQAIGSGRTGRCGWWCRTQTTLASSVAVVRTVPHVFGFVEDFWNSHICKKKKNTKLYNTRISLTCTLHSQQNEHGDNSQESSNGINDDKFQRIIIWNEQDVEHCGGWQVACQETTGVGQNRFRVDDVQAEKGDCPNTVENLKGKWYDYWRFL